MSGYDAVLSGVIGWLIYRAIYYFIVARPLQKENRLYTQKELRAKYGDSYDNTDR
jgi:hypothetical protein